MGRLKVCFLEYSILCTYSHVPSRYRRGLPFFFCVPGHVSAEVNRLKSKPKVAAEPWSRHSHAGTLGCLAAACWHSKHIGGLAAPLSNGMLGGRETLITTERDACIIIIIAAAVVTIRCRLMGHPSLLWHPRGASPGSGLGP